MGNRVSTLWCKKSNLPLKGIDSDDTLSTNKSKQQLEKHKSFRNRHLSLSCLARDSKRTDSVECIPAAATLPRPTKLLNNETIIITRKEESNNDAHCLINAIKADNKNLENSILNKTNPSSRVDIEKKVDYFKPLDKANEMILRNSETILVNTILTAQETTMKVNTDLSRVLKVKMTKGEYRNVIHVSLAYRYATTTYAWRIIHYCVPAAHAYFTFHFLFI
ncbi:hypothetical protein GQX74_004009 [Glossina fuscipes]|nr:hypothetical protein GQX74_004009 [Glossina fuscipes]